MRPFIETPRTAFRFRYDTDLINIVIISAVSEEKAIEKANKKYPNTGIKRIHNEI